MENEKYRKSRDHCQYSGEYRGAAHSIYNLKYSVPKKIYIAFHNRSNSSANSFMIKFYHKRVSRRI